jgi:hypothetical protein
VHVSAHPARASREGPQTRGRTISSSRSLSPAGPFTAAIAAASNLSVGSGFVVIFSFLAHLTASARFRARAPGPVSGRLSETTSWRDWTSRPGSRCVSATGIRFSAILCPPRSWALLAVGLPDAKCAWTSTGLPRSARASWPSTPRGRRCSSRRGMCPTGACRFTGGQSLDPAPASHLARAPSYEASTRVQAIHPSGLPLPMAARVERAALGLLLGLAPRRPEADDARRGWDRPLSTDLELHAHIRLILQCAVREFLPLGNDSPASVMPPSGSAGGGLRLVGAAMSEALVGAGYEPVGVVSALDRAGGPSARPGGCDRRTAAGSVIVLD